MRITETESASTEPPPGSLARLSDRTLTDQRRAADVRGRPTADTGSRHP
ncbi:hypothetical protein [Halorubrum tebenquichense]|nr:hypothetical protein [Halorubrum tebenquichense]